MDDEMTEMSDKDKDSLGRTVFELDLLLSRTGQDALICRSDNGHIVIWAKADDDLVAMLKQAPDGGFGEAYTWEPRDAPDNEGPDL